MKNHLLILWCVCFHLIAAFSEGRVCFGASNSSILTFCQNNSLSGPFFVLDSSGFLVGDIGGCACTLSNNDGTLISVNIAAVHQSQPGNFELVVDGYKIHTPVNVPFTSQIDIVLLKLSIENIVQCLYVSGEYNGRSESSIMHVACTKLQHITTQPPHITGPPTTTQSVNTPSSTVAPSETTATTQPDSHTASTVAPTESPTTKQPVRNPATTVVPSGIIAGGVAGGLVVIITIIAVIIVLRRKHNRKGRHTESMGPVPNYFNVASIPREQLNNTATHSSKSTEYVNTQLGSEPVTSSATQMNMYECLTPHGQRVDDRNYDSLAREDIGAHTNNGVSRDLSETNTEVNYECLYRTGIDEHVYNHLSK